MAKIRHIAFYTDDPEKEADFYVRAFELKRVRTSPTGSVFLSDGYINVALLKAKGDGTKNGIHHFGFQVDSVDSATERLRGIRKDIRIVEPHSEVTFAEYKVEDPDGNPFDISEKGWQV
jgi:catechol 2,3-dioxygenase-like lactoylglutathione lyase family enzyme